MEFIRNYIGWIFESQKDRAKLLTEEEIRKIIGESEVEQQRLMIKKQYPLKTTFAEALEITASINPEGLSRDNVYIHYASPFSFGRGDRVGEHILLPDLYSFNLTFDVKWIPGSGYPSGQTASYHAYFDDDAPYDPNESRAILRNSYRSFRTYEQGIKEANPVTLERVCSEFYENTYLKYYASCLNVQMAKRVI